MPKVSIIIPTYNAVDYFEECLNSLNNQTLKEIEIIIVLDCPTDGTDLIAEKYREKDTRIKVVRNQVNLHAGYCRNVGMQYAIGEYIGFCDADDWVKPNMYELLYNKAMEENAEIIRCNNFRQKNGKYIDYYKFPELPVEQIFDFSIREILKYRMCGSVTNHIFKTDLVKKHNFYFIDSRIMIAEDRKFLYQAYSVANKLALVSEPLYYYRENPESMVNSIEHWHPKKAILFYENLKHWLIEENIYEKYQDCYLEGFLRIIYSDFRVFLRYTSFKKAFQEIRMIKKNNVMLENINQLMKFRRFFYFLRIKPTAILLFLLIKIV